MAVRGDLARWVEDHVDALVRAFTSENDGVVVITDEGDVVNDGDGAVPSAAMIPTKVMTMRAMRPWTMQ